VDRLERVVQRLGMTLPSFDNLIDHQNLYLEDLSQIYLEQDFNYEHLVFWGT
jgi:hypothetical protein